MVDERNPKIGVLADDSLQRHALSRLVRVHGYELAVAAAPDRLDWAWVTEPELDAWVVDLMAEDEWAELLDDLLEQGATPILFGDGQPAPSPNSYAFPRWQRRLFAKLRDIAGPPVLMEETAHQLEELKLETDEQAHAKSMPMPELAPEALGTGPGGMQVWVLGSSLGGPDAVKAFLDSLPANLPVALVLGQHINEGFEATLAQVLGRHTRWRLRLADEGVELRCGEVLIAPMDQEISFREDRVRREGKAWPGPYAPSIDQLMLNVAHAYGHDCGAIIFSGMGNDGAIAAPQLIEQSAEVWVQSPDTCANASMPEAVQATGCVSFEGSPQMLAYHMVQMMGSMATAQRQPTS